MLQSWVIITVSLVYIGTLFAIAYYGDKRADSGRSLINNPYIYALSLAVYCTAWTFYGSVGRAASAGIGFLPIYLGPTLLIIGWWFVLRKIIRISKHNHITSIADFIASRYGKNAKLGGLVAFVAVWGIIPYIGLQLKAVSTSYTILQNYPSIEMPTSVHLIPILGDTAFYVTILLAIFTILFGTRHLDATEHHEGLVVAIAFESVIKLVAFMGAGLFVTYFVHDGFGDLFSKVASNPDLTDLFTMQSNYNDWVGLMFLSAMAVVCLPRQFQMGVIENVNEKYLNKAMWLFPLYLLIINIFVLPIAFGGRLMFPNGDVLADTFVLAIPMAHHQQSLALLVFIGGLSAATSMVVVATVTLSTMVSNDLVMPVLLRVPVFGIAQRGDLTNLLLNIRRGAIVIILLLSYSYIRMIGDSRELVSIGLISFSAVAQFAPLIFGGIYWKQGNRLGALIGLSSGFLVWSYTLGLPSLVGSGLFSHNFIEQGPWGITFLKPYALFGLDGINPITHALIWSMMVNIGAYVIVSLVWEPRNLIDHKQALLFVDVFDETGEQADISVWRGKVSVATLHELLERFLGTSRAGELLTKYANWHSVDWIEIAEADPQLIDYVERRLAGVIGAASAQVVVASTIKEKPLSAQEVMSILDETSTNYRLLSEQLQTYSQELEQKNEALERMDKLKDDFLANTSHELRTPLNGIIGLTESMIDGATGELTHEQQKTLSMVVSGGHRLTNLINDILDFSKLKHDALTLQLRPIRLRTLVDVVLTLSMPLVGSKSIKLVNSISSDTPAVYGDENRIQQVFYNLIGNAIKFTASGKVEVSANIIPPEGETEKKNGEIEIRITDTGIGISAEKQETIFKAFEQADGFIAREYGGTGLGLTVTEQLVALHGGTMQVESTPGEGSMFSFTLTIASAEDQTVTDDDELSFANRSIVTVSIIEDDDVSAVTPAQPVDEKAFRVLVVDDEPVNLQVLVNQLTLQNYQVVEAHNGFEALELIESEAPFDLIVLDVMMPRMSGYEVCREIRREYPAAELPVILLTAKNRATDLIAGFDAGANDYLTKPFSSAELLVRVKTHVQLTTLYHNLQKHQHQLEELVAARTLRLEIVAALSEHLNAILDFDKLLSEVVTKVQESFGYYHAHIYRLNQEEEQLVLAEGTGQAGLQMKADEHQIPLNSESGLVAQAARTGQIAWSSDVQQDENWLANPLLPETRSEMAVPIITEGQVVGVLDVQQDKIAGLDDGDANLLRSLASQIGVAIKNAQLYGFAQQANEELHRLNTDKDKFFSIVAHDLRGPFGPVRGLAQLLYEMHDDFGPEEIKETCLGIYRSAENVYHLLENLLEWSRLQGGRMDYQPDSVDLQAVIKQIIDLLQDTADTKEITLHDKVVEPIWVVADRYMLNTILRNLASNALKFTPENGHVTISAKVDQTWGTSSKLAPYVQILVSDTGVGINEDDIEKLFQLGKTHTTIGTANEKGTGLGLVMCAEMVEKHGGQIWIESVVDQGTTFIFTMPLDETQLIPTFSDEPIKNIPSDMNLTTSVVIEEKFIIPSNDELKILLDLALMGDMRGVQEKAVYFQSLDECYTPFSDKLRELAQGFEDEKLIELVEQHLI
ncbi:ATP-binding protein [Anaerolineales bacterium HSG25]|nr:ATP-binding protein [Anaerolineales bacterium HSG25]